MLSSPDRRPTSTFLVVFHRLTYLISIDSKCVCSPKTSVQTTVLCLRNQTSGRNSGCTSRNVRSLSSRLCSRAGYRITRWHHDALERLRASSSLCTLTVKTLDPGPFSPGYCRSVAAVFVKTHPRTPSQSSHTEQSVKHTSYRLPWLLRAPPRPPGLFRDRNLHPGFR